MRDYKIRDETKARNEEIGKLYQGGACIYDIGIAFCLQPSTVEGILHELGFSTSDKRYAKSVIRTPKVYPVIIDGKQYYDITELFLMY